MDGTDRIAPPREGNVPLPSDLGVMLSHLPDIVFRLDRELRHVFIGGAVDRISELHPERFIGKTGRELDFPPELCDRFEAACREVLESGQPRTFEAPIRNVWVSHRLIPERSSDGVVRSILGIAEDITQRKRLEELERTSKARLRGQVAAKTAELRDQAARLAAILETAADSIITIDGRGIIQSVNPAAVRAFGYTAAEMLGRNVSLLMPAPFRDEHDGYIARYRTTGERRIIGIGREAQARRKDGSLFPIDLAVSEVVKGQLFTGMIRDTSERAEAAQRLRESERMSSLGVLAAGLAHDMNNMLLPLRAHLGVAGASAGDARARRSIRDASRIAESIQDMADGLHYLAADGGEDDARGRTSLHEWWEQVGPMLSRSVPRHAVVRASLPRSLPPVSISAHRLTQAVLNLIVNAGQAMPPAAARGSRERAGRSGKAPAGGRRRVRGAVSVTARAAKTRPRLGKGASTGLVRLVVRDNGSGMTEEVKRRAFELFFSTKPRGLGTGLGLPLVARVVHGVGGSVEIDSAPGKGTSVTLSLPVAPAERKAGRGASRHSPGALMAALSIVDRRAASLIRQLLHSAGVATPAGIDPRSARMWIVDPASVTPEGAAAWREQRRRSREEGVLVVLGPLTRGQNHAWNSLAPVVIEHPEDYFCIRDGIARALEHGSHAGGKKP